MKIYKYLSIFLAVLLLGAGAAYGFERWNNSKERKELKNQLAKVQTMQKETESAYSRLALENEDLKASNKDLQGIIEDRNEAILALTQAKIKLRDRVVKIENAKQIIVNSSGDVVEHPSCEVSEDIRFRVDFEKEEDPLKITGYTLTNPAYAEVKLEWMRELKLELVLTQDPDKTYRVYIDSEKSDIVPTDLVLQVDPSVLEYKWYQKIGFGTGFVAGETGIAFNISAFYDVLPNFYIGPTFQLAYMRNNAETFYGVVVGYYPWK